MCTRRYAKWDPPTFKQTIAITREVIRRYPTEDFGSRVESIKRRHTALGFEYSGDQIHRALSAVLHQMRDPRPPNRGNKRSDRWT